MQMIKTLCALIAARKKVFRETGEWRRWQARAVQKGGIVTNEENGGAAVMVNATYHTKTDEGQEMEEHNSGRRLECQLRRSGR